MTVRKFGSTAALFVLLFVVIGFSDGWASAVRQCLAVMYCFSTICLVMSAALASTFDELKRDRSIWALAAVTLVLGCTTFVMLGARSLYAMSLLGAGCGAFIGSFVRFGMSNTARRLGRSERRLIRRIAKRFGFGRR